MNSKVKLITKIVLLLAMFSSMADMLVTPAFEQIASSFPEISSSVYNLFLTGPMITYTVATILTGVLAWRISKKHLLVGSYILFAVSAGGGAFIPEMGYMIAMRLVAGFAYGISATAAMALIVELIVDETERSKMMGAMNSVSAAIGVALSLVGGFIVTGTGNWRPVFIPYWFSVVILVLIIAFIPRTAPEGRGKSETDKTKQDKFPTKKLLPILLSFAAVGALYFISLYYVSFYVDETGMGDAGTAGVLSSVGTASGFLAGLTFSQMYAKVGRVTPTVSIFIIALGFLGLAFPTNIWLVGVMYFLLGFGYITLNSYYFMHSSMIVPPGVMTITMGILSAVMNIGGFVSAYLYDAYGMVFNAESTASRFLYIAITLAVGGVISIILAIRSRTKTDMPEMAE